MKRPSRSSTKAAAVAASAKPVRLGDVTPGNWARLPSGEEVRVSWHSKRRTLVRRAVPAEQKYSQPEDMDSDTPVIERPRVVDYVDDGVVQDPLGGLS